MRFQTLVVSASFFIVGLVACSGPKKMSGSGVHTLDTVVVMADRKGPGYRESVEKKFDLIHTRLELKLNWKKQELEGKATIMLHPHFYAQDSLLLDAKGMDIRKVFIIQKDLSENTLRYTYDSLKLRIFLGDTYTSIDTLKIGIHYIARPTQLNFLGSEAIEEARGLYFINHDGSDLYKPRQVWTQGETESASCWFPTLDAPNQKMTQDLIITVDSNYVSVSNGLLQYSLMNPDGSHTDYWKQSLPAAPYLSMFAVGEFAVVKDQWRNIEVNYYVEPEFKQYAKNIFGSTPEMIEFFSKKFGVNYPWEKFSQICVRDFVSGAMENTTVVVHGEDLQRTSRELIDNAGEEYISHELVHHWFGDYVTCESWSNLPLNESFATYGEYLWNEFKHGRDEADYAFKHDLDTYLGNAENRPFDLIRFYYDDKEDMFDPISYQKGGRVLHMLRKAVGDSAFFEALKLYLSSHSFSSAEIHDLRLAFEQVTGTDLNWFFNQWFLNKGYPELEITYGWDDSTRTQRVLIRQTQNMDSAPVYKIPLAIDIYADDGAVQRKYIRLSERSEEFKFHLFSKPALVNVDAEKMLLCKKKDMHTKEEWVFQFYHAPLFLDRNEALHQINRLSKKDTTLETVVVHAMDDPFRIMRSEAIGSLNCKAISNKDLKQKLMYIATHDSASVVRLAALKALGHCYQSNDLIETLKLAVRDSSYNVADKALSLLIPSDSSFVLAFAKSNEADHTESMRNMISKVYAAYGSDEQYGYFKSTLHSSQGDLFGIRYFSRFLSRCSKPVVHNGALTLDQMARTGKPWYVRLTALQALDSLRSSLLNRSPKGSENNVADTAESALIEDQIKAILKDENDARVGKYYLRKEKDLRIE